MTEALDLTTLPPHEASETLSDYLKRCIDARAVNITALSRELGVNRAGLYKIRDGRLTAEHTLARFGALAGVLHDTETSRHTLALLGLLEAAIKGWAARSELLGSKPDLSG